MFRTVLALLLLACAVPALALHVQITAASIEHPDLPSPLTQVQLSCDLTASADLASCRKGRLRAALQDQPLDATFDARVSRDGQWQVNGRAAASALTLSDASGRYASDKLRVSLSGFISQTADRIRAEVNASLPQGQAYVEPVFVDFGAAPATMSVTLRIDTASSALTVETFEIEQAGVLRARGRVRPSPGAAPMIEAQFDALHLASAFATYLAPFLAGTPMEHLALSGLARGQVVFAGAEPRQLALHLQQAGIESEAYASGVRDLSGTLNWSATGEGQASALNWSGGHLAKLELGAAQLHFRSAARDVELLAPLRLPLAGGALQVHTLAVQRAGQTDMTARFDAEIEPLDLAALCRAFGWPEFGGQLGGRLPGVSLQDGELKLAGALTAKAFDGDIALDGLRVLDPFGRVPRVEADIRLRNLDLAALTGAFSFGRIEGRLDGDVQDLRLLNWEPISFRARIATPPNDRSRHRISQRAIDNISAIGGGPTGVLSRGALRFFKDFAYARIGWSCILANGVCRMDGIKPARDGGYVLVQGRLLPRIDVVGYSREVDWRTFVSQLKSARDSEGVQVR